MTTESGGSRPISADPISADPISADDLTRRLDRWVAQGLITEEQARRIREAESGAPAGAHPARAASLVTEGLGYIGGVLILVAAATITGRYWSDLGEGARLAVAFGAAAALLAAGAALPKRLGAVTRRLRAVSWVLCVALVAAGLGLLGEDVLRAPDESVVLLAAAGAALLGALLWAWNRTVLQQAALLAALAVLAGAAAAHLPHGDTEVAGLAVWGVGVVWLLLGWGAVVAARAAAYVLGGATAVIATMLTVSTDWGSWLAIASAVALVAAGVVLRDLVLLGVGSVATLVTVPVVLSRWFPDTLTAPLALLAVGALLVVGALQTARRRRDARAAAARDRGGSPRTAVMAAAVTAVAVAVPVVVLGLG